MRLAMVLSQFPTISETFIARKFVGLLDRGWDVHIVCRRSDRSQRALFSDIVDSEAIEPRFHVHKDLNAILMNLQPDLIHFEFAPIARGRTFLGFLLDCPIIVSFRGYDINYHGLNSSDFYDEVWNRADAIHTLGRELWQRIQERGCPTDKYTVIIPPAIDLDYFEPVGRSHVAVAGTSERPLRILSVGRLHWKKGYEHALEAVQLLAKQGIHAEYRVIGDGKHNEAVAFTVRDLGLRDQVCLLGSQPPSSVKENMLWADVLLHAAVSEGFCNAVIEAQSMALPVVCSDADGLSENIADKETGFVVPRRDSPGFAEKLALLAAEPGLRQRMGDAGRKRAVTHFSISSQMSSFDKMYREVCDRFISHDLLPHGVAHYIGQISQLREAFINQVAKGDPARREALNSIRREIQKAIPRDAVVTAISKGDDDLLHLHGGEGWHFPQTDDGVYAGYHPSDSAEAIAHLQTQRARGAGYLVIPNSAFWWRDYYQDFWFHLDRSYQCVLESEYSVVYRLSGEHETGISMLAQGGVKSADDSA